MSCNTIGNFTVFTTVFPFGRNSRVLHVVGMLEKHTETGKPQYWTRQGPTNAIPIKAGRPEVIFLLPFPLILILIVISAISRLFLV